MMEAFRGGAFKDPFGIESSPSEIGKIRGLTNEFTRVSLPDFLEKAKVLGVDLKWYSEPSDPGSIIFTTEKFKLFSKAAKIKLTINIEGPSTNNPKMSMKCDVFDEKLYTMAKKVVEDFAIAHGIEPDVALNPKAAARIAPIPSAMPSQKREI